MKIRAWIAYRLLGQLDLISESQQAIAQLRAENLSLKIENRRLERQVEGIANATSLMVGMMERRLFLDQPRAQA